MHYKINRQNGSCYFILILDMPWLMSRDFLLYEWSLYDDQIVFFEHVMHIY